ncbi:hypothetical protein BJ138DRAFT_1083479 [Hygrophoropsis aurantiaca]|uniref:Uncharacterized protein n=1 Tax=Hygrophoropsis aurantiaca TaxID=72124 RepID=A0ACB8AGA1_9AGAM|nr:hypothetical protein BJ138DRAFT_1083479 [Hygrophoropsis aurantiaca]
MGPPNDHSIPAETQESLASYFEKSARIVREYADNIEHNYARPLLKYFIQRFQAKPVAVTFTTIFCILSLLPALSFIGISLFVISFFTFLAIAGAFLASAIAETVFVAVLASTVVALFLVSIFLTACVLFSYLSLRLGVLVQAEGRSGITEWAHETKNHFISTNKNGEESDDSENSGVFIQPDGNVARKAKPEEVEN